MLKSKVVIPICLLLVPALVWASDDQTVEMWLQKMHRAAHMLNYTGKFVYQQDKQLSLMNIVHAVTEEGEREKLVSMDDTGREVIREKDRVTCIMPDSKSVMVEKGRPKVQFPPMFPVKWDQLKGQYTFQIDRLETIAGQRAQKLVIQPVDKFRYGHRLWVDQNTGLLLKTQLLDEQGKLLEQFMFTEIQFLDKVPEELLKPRATGTEYTWYEAQDSGEPEVRDTQHIWEVQELPNGFVNDMTRYHRMPDKMPVEHMVFTDGLASVSVFIEKNQGKEPALMGSSRMGAVNAYGRTLNNYHIITVGEVPRQTVRMIGESVVYKSK